MTAITPLKIPVTVNTEAVGPAMKQVERTVKDSAGRISQIRGAITPALGALGMGQGASILGGFSQMGGPVGNAALGAGAFLGGLSAPSMIADKWFGSMQEASAGATEALNRFRETGQQTYAANSVMLEAYANLEQKAKALAGDDKGFVSNFQLAAQRGGGASWLDRELMVIKEGWKGIGAFLGTLVGGGSVREAGLAEELALTPSEQEAQRLRREIAMERASPRDYSNPWAAPVVTALASIDRKLD